MIGEARRDALRAHIVDVVGTVEPGLTRPAVAGAILRAAPGARQLRRLAAALDADPQQCLVTNPPDTPSVVGLLIDALVDAGATTVPPRVGSRSRRRTTCSACGRLGGVAVIWASGPVCATCYKRNLAAKGTCECCGQRRRIDPRNRNGRELCSDCARLPPMSVCDQCGREDRIYRDRRCFNCVLAERLDEILAGPDRTVPASLSALRAFLVAVESPRAMLRWLANPNVADTLARLAAGDLAVTHEGLDELGDTNWAAHLHHVLVAAGTLPVRDEPLARLEAWIAAQTAMVTNAEDRHLVTTFATWWVLRRRRARRSRNPAASVGQDHATILWAIRLLGWLRDHDLTIGSCTQADIDLWLASGPPSRRDARIFLRWARRRHLAGHVDIVRRPAAIPVPDADPVALAGIVRRLLDDDRLALADRIAGLLVLLYGQPASRIVTLRTDKIGQDNGVATLRLGNTSINLPEPFGTLIRRHCAARRGHSALTSPEDPWLFPSVQPGRHLSAEQLAKRLNAIGIKARGARTTVLLELAGELPATVIADMLGLNPGTAVRWIHAAGGDWTSYAAERAAKSCSQN